MLTVAAAAEASRGWGGPVALLVVLVVFIIGATVHYGWLEKRGGLPSPTGRGDTDPGVKPQVEAVSDTDDTTGDTGWWGRLTTLPDGRRVRTSAPPPDRDEEVDLDLVDEEPETVEDVIGRMLDRGHPYAEIVRAIMEEFEVSEATAKRRIRDVRAERIAAS